ncbi:hypothetical protein PoB_006017700 [Plakobranchus ocellatus]|uniref:Uncharacterized protein n=1 Tax=Plakobranchus ocellatus TaxID=259542 RepID=A0AAV4CP85_9GAST|nr:hypothetical protein PoB_006017700 [Plakobranchus ocellatus]
MKLHSFSPGIPLRLKDKLKCRPTSTASPRCDDLRPSGRPLGQMSGGIDGTVASESALRSAGNLLSRVLAPPPAPWPDLGPESLRSPCGLAILYTINQS